MQASLTRWTPEWLGDPSGRVKRATAIAILFHLTGLLGMVLVDRSFFAALTPFNVLLMSFLNWWSGRGRQHGLSLFPILAYVTGMTVEVIGVRTGMLFGHYEYGTVLGPRVLGVPWLIGMNWFLVLSGATALAGNLHELALRHLPRLAPMAFTRLAPFTRVVTAALLAVLFDRIMEPVAVELGFWHWRDGVIPFYNYACWFIVSLWIILVGRHLMAGSVNGFTGNLFLIQALFFLLLGILL